MSGGLSPGTSLSRFFATIGTQVPDAPRFTDLKHEGV
ncbi:hypothetical protein TMRO357_01128 [Alteriqipengyuania sp. 357]